MDRVFLSLECPGYHGTEKLGDRAISAAIAAVCGLLLGLLLGRVAVVLFGQSCGLVWISVISAAAFGFFAPAQSREIWTAVWTGILGFFYKLLDTRRFYR